MTRAGPEQCWACLPTKISKIVLREFKEVLIKTYVDGVCPVTYDEEDGEEIGFQAVNLTL
jgi:hypothetical protein